MWNFYEFCNRLNNEMAFDFDALRQKLAAKKAAMQPQPEPQPEAPVAAKPPVETKPAAVEPPAPTPAAPAAPKGNAFKNRVAQAAKTAAAAAAAAPETPPAEPKNAVQPTAEVPPPEAAKPMSFKDRVAGAKAGTGQAGGKKVIEPTLADPTAKMRIGEKDLEKMDKWRYTANPQKLDKILKKFHIPFVDPETGEQTTVVDYMAAHTPQQPMIVKAGIPGEKEGNAGRFPVPVPPEKYPYVCKFSQQSLVDKVAQKDDRAEKQDRLNLDPNATGAEGVGPGLRKKQGRTPTNRSPLESQISDLDKSVWEIAARFIGKGKSVRLADVVRETAKRMMPVGGLGQKPSPEQVAQALLNVISVDAKRKGKIPLPSGEELSDKPILMVGNSAKPTKNGGATKINYKLITPERLGAIGLDNLTIAMPQTAPDDIFSLPSSVSHHAGDNVSNQVSVPETNPTLTAQQQIDSQLLSQALLGNDQTKAEQLMDKLTANNLETWQKVSRHASQALEGKPEAQELLKVLDGIALEKFGGKAEQVQWVEYLSLMEAFMP